MKKLIIFKIVVFTIAIICGTLLENNIDRRSQLVNQWFSNAITKTKAQSYWDEIDSNKVKKLLLYAWTKWKIHPTKALGVWMHESQMRWYAVGYNSYSTDIGLAQINTLTDPWLRNVAKNYCINHQMKRLYKKLIRSNLYDVETNAFMSLYYMHILQRQYGKGAVSIVAYNSGRRVRIQGIFLQYYTAVSQRIKTLRSSI